MKYAERDNIFVAQMARALNTPNSGVASSSLAEDGRDRPQFADFLRRFHVSRSSAPRLLAAAWEVTVAGKQAMPVEIRPIDEPTACGNAGFFFWRNYGTDSGPT